MDLYIDTTPGELIKVFKLLNFEIIKKENYFSAILKTSQGRFHVMFAKLGDKAYCDFHFDNKKHWLLFGVDYKNKPKEYFQENLRRIFESKKIKFTIKEVNWFTRRNRAIFRGFRL